MNLLANENLDRALVEWLRERGNDVNWIYESSPSVDDYKVLDLAIDEQRVIITSDLDFGEYVYRNGFQLTGVVLLRFSASSEADRLVRLQRHWPLVKHRIAGSFIVLADERIRIRPLT